MVAQKGLPFKWESTDAETGETAYAGLPILFDVMATVGLPGLIEKHLNVRPKQGWTDIQQVTSLLLLQWAGGECVADIEMLESDPGLCRIVDRLEQHRLWPKARKRLENRFRRDTERTFPSAPAIRAYLNEFQPDEPMALAEGPEGATIEQPSGALQGLRELVAEVACFEEAWPKKQESTATLDVDATLIESANQSASFCYKGYPAYQPVNVFWHEKRQVLFSEFRDGNCPASWRLDQVIGQAIRCLPDSVKTLRLRSDTAGYQTKLLRAMIEGDLGNWGEPIEFAVGVPIEDSFREACRVVEAEDWTSLSNRQDRAEYTSIPHVPNWVGQTKEDWHLRFIAIRTPVEQSSLPNIESAQQSLPLVELDDQSFELRGIVTNLDASINEIIDWYYERCGYGEKHHSDLKTELGAGMFPSSEHLQVNAAWWQMTLLGYNLEVLLQRDILGRHNHQICRMKRLRFELLCLPGRVVRHAGQLTIKVPTEQPGFQKLKQARDLLELFRRGPPTPWLDPPADAA